MVLVTAGELDALIRTCFQRLGLARADAGVVAEALVDANLRGNESHGLARAPVYMRRVAAGAAGGSERIVELASSGPVRRLDAGAALGPAAAMRATERAIGLAREHGVGLVAVRNSSHLGAAGFFARRGAAQGMMMIVATNGPANMAPYGSAQRFLGTNALAVGVPLGQRGEFVLDMSCSIVARGKLLRARELGEPIEPGLAIDPDGNPTTDPAAAIAGAVLPLGGPKGTGLALAISLLVGILSGAAFDDEVVPMHGGGAEPQRLGHVLCAIDPWCVADRDETARRVEGLVDRLHALAPLPGVERVLYPGERGELEREARLRSGIPVEPAEIEALAACCEDLGLADAAARARKLASTAGD